MPWKFLYLVVASSLDSSEKVFQFHADSRARKQWEVMSFCASDDDPHVEFINSIA